ncbi:EpsG family protein [Sphingomonas sp. 3-13AW]|uniref:EpsG family protein n=1 Tax=Sphingomonas sp. 3-13AW TaxID=3050450 RepID=UPI003BB7F899
MTPGTAHVDQPPEQVSFAQGALWLLAYILLAAAIYISGVKPIGISADLRNYELLYNASAINDWPTILTGADLGYFALAKLAAAAGWSFDLFTFVLAAGTCLLLFVVATRLDTNRIVLVAIYGSYLFWLHSYTQIRIAAAIAIGLYAIYVARPAIRWPLFAVAVLLHNSFVLAVVAYALLKARRIDVVVALAVGVLVLLLSPLGAGLVQRVVSYQDLASTTGQFTDINLLSLMPLVQLCGLGCAVVHFKELPLQGKEETVLATIGAVSFYLLSPIPVLAFRTFELFMPFFVILLSRLWGMSVVIRGIILIWMVLGLRSAFFAVDSTVIM